MKEPRLFYSKYTSRNVSKECGCRNKTAKSGAIIYLWPKIPRKIKLRRLFTSFKQVDRINNEQKNNKNKLLDISNTYLST